MSAAPPIRAALQADWAELGHIVGSAFAHDPVSNWTLGGSAAITTAFTALGRHIYLPRGLCHLAPGQGGTMWLGPGGSKDLPLLPQLQLITRLVRMSGIGVVSRALAVDAAMKRRRLAAPHYYLFAVGVLPAARGQGLARRLIGELLARADAEGLPAWLENSNPRNESLYRGLGFTPVETFEAAPGCPPLTTMQRAPHA